MIVYTGHGSVKLSSNFHVKSRCIVMNLTLAEDEGFLYGRIIVVIFLTFPLFFIWSQWLILHTCILTKEANSCTNHVGGSVFEPLTY